MNKAFDFGWQVGLAVGLDLSQEEMARCVNDLNAAIVNAIANVVMTFPDSGSEVHVAACDNEKTQKLVTFRTAFEIARLGTPAETQALDSATAAVDELIRMRADGSPGLSHRLGLIRHPDGSFRVAERHWSSCEFDTEI